MKLSDECANFTLNTLNSGSTTPNNTEFSNINIQNILGDMYEKYNKFVLICTVVSFGVQGTTPPDGLSNQLTQFKINGLSFSNAGYNNSGASTSPVFAIYPILPKTTYNFGINNTRVCFYKPPPIVNLRIVAENLKTLQPSVYNTEFILYQFNIFGLYDD